MTDEAFKFFRGRYNTKGTIVYGFALYEKNLPTPRSLEKAFPNWVSKKPSGWELVHFYPYKFECEFWRPDGKAIGKTSAREN